MKKNRKIIIIVSIFIFIFIMSFFGNKHGISTEYKKISGVYEEQQVEKIEGLGIYETKLVELTGLNKGIVGIWGNCLSDMFSSIADVISDTIGMFYIIGEFSYGIGCFIDLLYDLINIIFNILLLFTIGGEIIILFLALPFISSIIEYVIGFIIGLFGDILGKIIIIGCIIYLQRRIISFFKKNKKGEIIKTAHKTTKFNKNTKKDINQKNDKNIFLIKLKLIHQKIWQFIISKKIYFIIIMSLLLFVLIFTILLKYNQRIGGNIIKLYDKYGEVSCEVFDIDFPDEYIHIYIKNDKILLNLNNETMIQDGNNFYSWGGGLFDDYFGGYMGCNFSNDEEDYLGNKIDVKRFLLNMFSGEDAVYKKLKCKNKVDDTIDFTPPKYCDFENKFSLSGRKEFKYRDLFSLKYPSGLSIKDYIYPYWSDFFDGGNIYVNIYDFESFIEPMLSKNYKNDGILLEMNEPEEKRGYYKTILQSIENGDDIKTINSSDFFDHFSYYNTIGPIAAHKINIDGINGLIINYYFTDDKTKGCASQFVTELLLIKNYNEIISIVFKNNFGYVEDLFKKGGFYFTGAYNYQETKKGEFCDEKTPTSEIEEFYKYGGHSRPDEFELNYEVIKEIIRTIKFN